MDAYTAGDIEAQVNASNDLDQTMATVIVAIENYPGLEGVTVVSNMMYEIAEAENQIAVAKLRYNENVRDYNAHIKKFPASMVAGWGDFEERSYYQPDTFEPAP